MTKPSATDIAQALSFDALGVAEELTGQSYKTDKLTESLGLIMHITHGQHKQAMLQAAGDTHMSMQFTDLLVMVEAEGFERLHTINFDGNVFYPNEPERPEEFIIFWHPDGILLTAESYDTRVNNVKIYFNAILSDDLNWRYGMSGHYAKRGDKTIAVGYIDVREGFRHTLNGLREHGFLPVWEESPFLWLLTYADTKVEGYDYVALNKERLSHLPEAVQKAINYKG